MLFRDLTYEQCLAQGIGPLVFPERLSVSDAHSAYSDEERAKMKTVCVQTIQNQVKLQHTLTVAWHALEEAGIHAVLMKGAGLAALYPSPEMRYWGDIDLFVGKAQYHPACAVMRATFPDAPRFDEELDHYKHYNLIPDGVSIEVHRVSVALTHPRDVRRFEKIEEFGMSNGEWLEVNGERFKVPEPTFNALLVFLHSWEHVMSGGACLRQWYDLTMVLHRYKDKIDRERLARWLRQLHLMEVWQLYAYNQVYCLGLSRNESVFYTDSVAPRAERLLDDLLSGRIAEPNENAKKNESSLSRNRFVRKWRTMQQRMAQADRIANYSPSYARHMKWAVLLSGAKRLFAKDRHWE